MVRGTTAQFKFQLPYTYGELGVVKVVFWQPGNNKLPLELGFDRCQGDDEKKELTVILDQEETLRFSDKSKAYVQLRAATSAEGNVFASKQEQITVYPVYGDDILDGVITPTLGNDGWSYIDGGVVK